MLILWFVRSSASKTAKFFYRDVDSTYPFWRLKTPEEHELETGIKSKEARKYIFNCLDDIGQVRIYVTIEHPLQVLAFDPGVTSYNLNYARIITLR